MCTLCILSHASCGRKHRSSLSLHLFPANPRLVQFNLSVKHDLLPQAQSQQKLKKNHFSLYELWRYTHLLQICNHENRLWMLKSWCGPLWGFPQVSGRLELETSKMTLKPRSVGWRDRGWWVSCRLKGVRCPHMGVFSSRWFGVERSVEQWVMSCLLELLLYYLVALFWQL